MGEHHLENWSAIEFETVEFGDERLNRRFIKTVGQLHNQPTSPINKACETWSDTKGAYRLFDNDKVDVEEILSAHQSRTIQRMAPENLVLAVQDTTYLNYDKHFAKSGLGKIGANQRKGFQGLVMHNTLVVNEQGLPLGLLDQQIYARKRDKKRVSNKQLPIEEKESYRWLKSMKRVKSLAPEGTTVVTVGDREADIFELFHFGQEHELPFVIRASWDRKLSGERLKSKKFLWNFMKKQPILGRIQVEVPKTAAADARTAFINVRIGKVKFKCPQRKGGVKHGPVSLYAVFLTEPNPPKQIESLEWMLLTNLPCHALEDAVEKVSWYKNRWQVEVYHKVLKSGCKVEECRLETAIRLEKFLTVMSIIAWRLHWMTHINRVIPDESCAVVFADHEWKALYIKIHRTRKIPKRPPNIQQAIRWMAQLGGFLARKSDKQPGIVSIWRGWQRLHDIAEDFLLFETGGVCG